MLSVDRAVSGIKKKEKEKENKKHKHTHLHADLTKAYEAKLLSAFSMVSKIM